MPVIGVGIKVLLNSFATTLLAQIHLEFNRIRLKYAVRIRETFEVIRETLERETSFDLHALSTPPAFILDQDQILNKNH